mgnify:CR=1 FL=1
MRPGSENHCGWKMVDQKGMGLDWNLEEWLKKIEEKVKCNGITKWRRGLELKSSLDHYALKTAPGYEEFYDGSFGACLLFKARSGSLELAIRTHRWDTLGSKLCQVCDEDLEENIQHFLWKCRGYEELRGRLQQMTENALGEEIEYDQNEIEFMLVALGLHIRSDLTIIGETKKYLEEAWVKRKRILNLLPSV